MWHSDEQSFSFGGFSNVDDSPQAASLSDSPLGWSTGSDGESSSSRMFTEDDVSSLSGSPFADGFFESHIDSSSGEYLSSSTHFEHTGSHPELRLGSEIPVAATESEQDYALPAEPPRRKHRGARPMPNHPAGNGGVMVQLGSGPTALMQPHNATDFVAAQQSQQQRRRRQQEMGAARMHARSATTGDAGAAAAAGVSSAAAAGVSSAAAAASWSTDHTYSTRPTRQQVQAGNQMYADRSGVPAATVVGEARPAGSYGQQNTDQRIHQPIVANADSLHTPLVIAGEDQDGDGLLQLQSNATAASGRASKASGKRRKGMHKDKSLCSNDHAVDVEYIAFQRQRKLEGNIALTQHGLKLSSRAGDFAEWHEQLDPDDHFQAGDVVGLIGSKVTFVTSGATMAGIITKKAVVVGSTPRMSSPSQRGIDTDSDTAHSCSPRPVGQEVAYCGRVPVRVRGVCFAGDALTASGLNDGTAVPIHTANLDLSSSRQCISGCGRCTRMLLCRWPIPSRMVLVVGVALHDSIAAHTANVAMGACRFDRFA